MTAPKRKPAHEWLEAFIDGECASLGITRADLESLVVCARHQGSRVTPETEFICHGCGRVVCGVCEGADDNMPDHCDQCWEPEDES